MDASLYILYPVDGSNEERVISNVKQFLDNWNEEEDTNFRTADEFNEHMGDIGGDYNLVKLVMPKTLYILKWFNEVSVIHDVDEWLKEYNEDMETDFHTAEEFNEGQQYQYGYYEDCYLTPLKL